MSNVLLLVIVAFTIHVSSDVDKPKSHVTVIDFLSVEIVDSDNIVPPLSETLEKPTSHFISLIATLLLIVKVSVKIA